MRLDLRKEYVQSFLPQLVQSHTLIEKFPDMCESPGQEHYALLTAIGAQLRNATILEFGTHMGNSSYCLALGNKWFQNNNRVITYDIVQKPRGLIDKDNIEYRLENMFDIHVREKNKDLILSSEVLFIDIDPHEGILEYDMYVWLKTHKYSGLVLFDDIRLTAGHMGSKSKHSMQEFWSKVDDKDKIDITSVGHWSGTGLVRFTDAHTILLD